MNLHTWVHRTINPRLVCLTLQRTAYKLIKLIRQSTSFLSVRSDWNLMFSEIMELRLVTLPHPDHILATLRDMESSHVGPI